MSAQIVALISGVFVFAGALLTAAAAIGLVRFGDTLSRMHPAAKPQTLGLVLVLTGAAIRTWGLPGVGILVLAGLSALATAPVVTNRVGAVAFTESAVTGSGPGAGAGATATRPRPRPGYDEPERGREAEDRGTADREAEDRTPKG